MANNWYCSSTAQGNHDGTSWDNAWALAHNGTFPIVWGTGGVVAGDTLYIDGGSSSITYTSTEGYPYGLLNIAASGTSGNPITIATGAKSPSPTNHDGLVIFDGNATYDPLIWHNNHSYITIDGEKNGVANWELRNTPFTTNKVAVLISNGGSHSGNIIRYLTIHNSPRGITAGNATNLEIDHCTFYDIREEYAINSVGGTVDDFANIKVHHNNIQLLTDPNNSNYGPDGLQATYGVDFYNNVCSTATGSTKGSQHGDFYQGDLRHTRIYNNTFNGSNNAVTWTNWAGGAGPVLLEDVYFYNNVINHPGWYGAFFKTPIPCTNVNRFYVVNNTFIDAHNQGSFLIAILSATTVFADVYFENNIFYNNNGGGDGKIGYINSTATTDQCNAIVFDYNVIRAGATGGTGFTCAGVTKSQAHGSTSVDPLFVSYTVDNYNNNLHLQVGDTAARGKGIDLTSLGIATTDKDGVPRPNGSPWDIGAYQFESTGSKIIIHKHSALA